LTCPARETLLVTILCRLKTVLGIKNNWYRRQTYNNDKKKTLKTLNAELNSICHLLILLGAHHILHVSWIGVQPAQNHKIMLDGLVIPFDNTIYNF